MKTEEERFIDAFAHRMVYVAVGASLAGFRQGLHAIIQRQTRAEN